jgi:RES domain-containing protein
VTPLIPPLGLGEFVVWRMDRAIYAPSWDSGEGAFQGGGRWNTKGILHVVYCAVDPATAILEVAVHKGFRILDTMPHVMTSLQIEPDAVAKIHVVDPKSVPNHHWLTPGIPSIGQQQFGDDLISKHDFVLFPSVVSKNSWNLLFDPGKAKGKYALIDQEPFALDTRLHSAP